MKTTKAEYDAFILSVEATVALLGLTNYRLYYEKRAIDAYAEISYDCLGMTATITCCTTHDSDFDPVLSGKHEALHLLLAGYTIEARARCTTEFALDQAEHSIVRRLERVL